MHTNDGTGEFITGAQKSSMARGDTHAFTRAVPIAVATPLTLIALLPGVSGVPVEETANTGGISSFSANGVRNNSNNLTVNGIGDIDTGLNGVQNVTVSLDSVQEFTALTGVYQAQYGRSSGAQVNLVTKSGTSTFHGSGYLYHRNEGMNALSPFNKEELLTEPLPGGGENPAFLKAPCRFNDIGYTIGGPIYIPGHFNTDKTKLFFFWSEEFQRQLVPNVDTTPNLWIPTAAEATGDFSADATLGNPNGNLIRDPDSGQPCTPTNHAGCFASVEMSGNGTNRTLKVKVTNTGTRAGAEVAQLYLAFPVEAHEPPRQLKGFEKISLAPRESKTATFVLNDDSFSTWDEATHQWKVFAGRYTAEVGGSSRDIREKRQLQLALGRT